jgi:2,3-bisphosphoglycerate-dependent phosphoglycerate mutase
MPEGGRKPHDEFAESESYINFRARAEMFWSKFIDKYEKEESKSRICIVSHGGMINMIFRSFMMLPVNTEVGISTGDTGIHLWKVKGNERRIIFLNKQEHLLELND